MMVEKLLLQTLCLIMTKKGLSVDNGLLSEGKDELWEVINNKYYANIDELKSYIITLGLKIKIEHIINFTWIVEIEN